MTLKQIRSHNAIVSRQMFGLRSSRGLTAIDVILALAAIALPMNAASLSGVVQTGGTGSVKPLANVGVTLFWLLPL